MLCEVDRGGETGLQSLRDAKLRRSESYLEWVRNNLSLRGEFQSPEKYVMHLDHLKEILSLIKQLGLFLRYLSHNNNVIYINEHKQNSKRRM